MKVEQEKRRFKIIAGFVIFFVLLFEKIWITDGQYSIWEIMFRISGGGFGKLGIPEILHLCLVIPALLTNVLYLIRSICLIMNKDNRFFEYLPPIGVGTYMIAIAVGLQFYFMINISLCIVDFMVTRWLEERDAINAAYEKQKALEQAEKEERKRIRYFPGRYPQEFFRMIRKNYRYGKSGHMILSAGCFLTAACMYILLTMYSLITQVHGQEDIFSTNGLQHFFLQTGILVVVFAVLMMTMLVSYYIKDQKNMNRLLVILGMRSRTVYLMFALLFGVNMVIAGILGTAGGMAVSWVLRDIWQSGFSSSGAAVVLESAISFRTVIFGLLGYLLVIFLSLAFNQENILNLARSMDRNTEVQKEKRSGRYAGRLICIGVLILVCGIRLLFARSWTESLYIPMFTIIGILLLLMGGTKIYLSWLEKDTDRYNEKLFSRRPLYYRYWKSLWNLFYLSVLHFFVLAVFGVQLAGAVMKQNIADLYPYDIVCNVYDADVEELTGIAKEHNAEMAVYPMFRMTSVYGSDKPAMWGGPRPVQWPQGQHAAISESTYRQMKEALGKTPKDLDLSGNEMHVVYQQDVSVKARTIDWDTARIEKRLRIGQPLMRYNPADIDNVFPVWQIKSEERDILSGAYHQGMEENLIVFADEYFDKEFARIEAYNEKQWPLREEASYDDWKVYTYSHKANMTEGPTRLFCITVPSGEYEGMAADIEYLDERHQFDRVWDESIHSFYAKQQMLADTGAEILFRRLVFLFILMLLTIMGFFQYYVKFESEAKEISWQNQFLKKLGMREDERKRVIASQLKLFLILPLAVGLCGGIIFAGFTMRARLYEAGELLSYGGAAVIVYLVYIGFWMVWYLWMKRLIWRQAQWEN